MNGIYRKKHNTVSSQIALTILLSVVLGGFAQAGGRRALAPPPTVAISPSAVPVPSPSASPIPLPAGPHRVSFDPITSASSSEKALILGAEAIMQGTIDSACFGNFILKADFKGQSNVGSGPQLSNADVLKRIRSAKGKIPTVVYWVPWYKPWANSTDGYTSPGDPSIHLNGAKLTQPCDIASLEAHEGIGHKYGGWDHDEDRTARRPFSVPYQINAAFSECCR